MTEQEIKVEIERYIKVSYSTWTIGITDDPDRRGTEHGNPQRWRHWYTTTEEVARRIESYFIEKGCKGDVGGGENPNYVYIF